MHLRVQWGPRWGPVRDYQHAPSTYARTPTIYFISTISTVCSKAKPRSRNVSIAGYRKKERKKEKSRKVIWWPSEWISKRLELKIFTGEPGMYLCILHKRSSTVRPLTVWLNTGNSCFRGDSFLHCRNSFLWLNYALYITKTTCIHLIIVKYVHWPTLGAIRQKKNDFVALFLQHVDRYIR